MSLGVAGSGTHIPFQDIFTLASIDLYVSGWFRVRPMSQNRHFFDATQSMSDGFEGI